MANEYVLQYGVVLVSESEYPEKHATEDGLVYLSSGEDEDGEALIIETHAHDPSFVFVAVGDVDTQSYLRELPSPPSWLGDVVNELQKLVPDCKCKWTMFETSR